MTRTTRAFLAAAALVYPACTATVDREGVTNVPGQEIWKTEIELQLGERAFVDGDRLQISLLRVGVDEAGLMVEADTGAREHTIRTGAGGALHIPPYEIRLLEVGIDNSARLQIRRQFGEMDR